MLPDDLEGFSVAFTLVIFVEDAPEDRLWAGYEFE
jgi:hypothetical protein